MHLKQLIKRFNASNFTVYCCLLIFSILLSLRVEGIIKWNYAAIFLPIWVWNLLTLVGVVVGIVYWIKKKNLRQDPDYRIHFKAILLSAVLQFPIFLTEILVVINIETGDHEWRAIFTPLYLLCGMSIAACIWSCWRKRGIELELLGMLNLLQLVFLGIQLDGVVDWPWAAVFVPSWVLLAAFVIGVVVYSCVCVAVYKLEETQQELDERRPGDIMAVICASAIAVFLIIFLALLVSQLDGRISIPYPAIFIPLHLAILCLIASTIARQPGNPWWFGIRKNFADLLLKVCPFLREYVNISYRWENDEESPIPPSANPKQRNKQLEAVAIWGQIPAHVYSCEDIYTPD